MQEKKILTAKCVADLDTDAYPAFHFDADPESGFSNANLQPLQLFNFDFDANRDPAFDFDEDPDPTVHFNVDTDPAAQNLDPCRSGSARW